MSSAKLKEWFARSSPAMTARLTGVLYLINGVVYTKADSLIHGRILVKDDAAATAHNILTNGSILQLSFACNLIATVTYIAVTFLLYELLKPVNRSISLLAAFFSMTGCIVGAVGSLFTIAPLTILGGAPYLSVFKAEQLQAMALLSLDLIAVAASVSMVFFGCYCFLIGTLILRSKFMPRIIGAFLIIAGLTYQLFLSPSLAAHLFSHLVMPAGALGEGSLILWLLLFGVNSQRWKQQAGVALQA
ncbi:MAG TPA: DUF4386 domain-containing protein [Terracidiphilus sp.]|jgi:hypothetical protein